MSILVLTSDTLIGTPAAGNIEYNGQFFGTDSNASRAQLQRIVLSTAVASTSGTSINFTDIPSWVKRVTVMFSGVSTNGSSLVQIQLGDSGGIETTGYNSGAVIQATATLYTGNVTTGFVTGVSGGSAANSLRYGTYIITTLGSNIWTGQGNIHESTSYTLGAQCAGAKTLSDTLDRVRITTVNGTDTFDAGTVNIMYEG
jgi:hypothetical protein